MKEVIVLTCIVFLLSTGSCLTKSDNPYQDEFTAAISKIDSEYIDHFPEKIDDDAAILLSEEKFVSHPRIWMKDYNVANVEKVEDPLRQDAVRIYSSSDSCLLILETYLTQGNQRQYDRRNGLSEEVEFDSCSLNNLPIPKFWDESIGENDSSSVGLNSGYTFYILAAKQNLVFPLEKLPNGRYTPPGWTHGYSRGIAVNKKQKTVIYWFDAW